MNAEYSQLVPKTAAQSDCWNIPSTREMTVKNEMTPMFFRCFDKGSEDGGVGNLGRYFWDFLSAPGGGALAAGFASGAAALPSAGPAADLVSVPAPLASPPSLGGAVFL